MSYWTHITGWLEVVPMGRTQEEKEYILKTVLNHLPVVQGSEEDMYVHIIQAGGHNSICSCDEYGYSTNNLKDVFAKNPRRSRNHGWLQTQDYYYLFVEGSLRDRTFDDTYRQFIKWLTRLAKRVRVKETDVLICADKGLRIDTDLFSDIFEEPTWSQCKEEIKYIFPYEDYDFNWCEHLMWE